LRLQQVAAPPIPGGMGRGTPRPEDAMIANNAALTPPTREPAPRTEALASDSSTDDRSGRAGPSIWIEPGTGRAYPISYAAYRRAREAEEKPLPRHRRLGPDVDRRLSRCWRSSAAGDVEVVLRVSPAAPPRIRRIVAEVLRSIRRGQSAASAIRGASKRFGLGRRRTLACIASCLGFEVRATFALISAVFAF